MKLLLVFLLSIFAYSAYAQQDEFVEQTPPPIDEVVKQKPARMRCFTGRANLTEDPRKSRVCRGKNKVCETKVEQQSNNGGVTIVSMCKRKKVCKNNRQNHQQQCLDSRGARVCHFCCDSADCNDLESVMEEMNGSEE